MGKLDQAVAALQKLYANRSALDKKILDAEKKLVTEAKAAAATPKQAAAKKPAAKKPAAKKPAAKAAPKS